MAKVTKRDDSQISEWETSLRGSLVKVVRAFKGKLLTPVTPVPTRAAQSSHPIRDQGRRHPGRVYALSTHAIPPTHIIPSHDPDDGHSGSDQDDPYWGEQESQQPDDVSRPAVSPPVSEVDHPADASSNRNRNNRRRGQRSTDSISGRQSSAQATVPIRQISGLPPGRNKSDSELQEILHKYVVLDAATPLPRNQPMNNEEFPKSKCTVCGYMAHMAVKCMICHDREHNPRLSITSLANIEQRAM